MGFGQMVAVLLRIASLTCALLTLAGLAVAVFAPSLNSRLVYAPWFAVAFFPLLSYILACSAVAAERNAGLDRTDPEEGRARKEAAGQ